MKWVLKYKSIPICLKVYMGIMTCRLSSQHWISCFVDTPMQVLVSAFSGALSSHFRMWRRLLFENLSHRWNFGIQENVSDSFTQQVLHVKSLKTSGKPIVEIREFWFYIALSFLLFILCLIVRESMCEWSWDLTAAWRWVSMPSGQPVLEEVEGRGYLLCVESVERF